MNWWNKYKKFILIAVVILLVLAVGTVVAILVRGPIACTLVGCSGGLTVDVTGLPAATPYQIKVSFPSGETRTLTCGTDPTTQTNTFDYSCTQTGAYFRLGSNGNPPKDVAVTVDVNGKSVTQLAHPKYEKFQPNGAGCEPVCYSATVQINISQ